MKYLAIPLLIFNFLFLAICDDFTEDITVNTTKTKTYTFDELPYNTINKKDSIQTDVSLLQK